MKILEGQASALSPIDLSMVVVNWNTRDLLSQCLASIERYPPNGVYEVWVVDNASPDGSVQMVRERFPWVQIVENRDNVGFARANNQAIRMCSGRYIVLLNSDVKIHTNTLQTILEFLDAEPDVAVVGCRLFNADGSLQRYPSRTLTLFRLFVIFWHLPGYSALWKGETESLQPREVERVKGACIAIRHAALEEVGLMDEGFFLYAEEDDWCLRFRRHRWKIVFLPDAEVTHYGGASTEQISAQARVHLYRSRTRFLRKHYGSVAARIFKLAILGTYIGKLVYSKLLSGLKPDRFGSDEIYIAVLRSARKF